MVEPDGALAGTGLRWSCDDATADLPVVNAADCLRPLKSRSKREVLAIKVLALAGQVAFKV